MQLIVYGASSFIGQHLIAYAVAKKYSVIALSRRDLSRVFTNANIQWIPWSFEQGPPSLEVEKNACGIHLAHDFRGGEGAKLTFNQTLNCIKALRELGVSKQLYYSSYSAGEHAQSCYGRLKKEIEDALIEQEDVTIVRPGLVLGKGGLFGRIEKWVECCPLVPLPDGGHDSVPVISIEKLCEETLSILELDKKCKGYNLFERKMMPLRDIISQLGRKKRAKTWIINIPTKWIVWGLRVGAWLRLPLPITEDNINGLRANQNALHQSSLKE